MLFGSQQAKAQKYYAANWWNTPPETWQFFAGADVAFPSDEGLGNPAFGIHAGMIKDFGFYGRILLNGKYSLMELGRIMHIQLMITPWILVIITC